MDSIPEFPEFVPLELKHKKLFKELFKKYIPEISEFNFTELYCWKDSYEPSISKIGDAVCIRIKRKEFDFFYPPICDENRFIEVTKKILLWHKEKGFEGKMIAVTESMLKNLGDAEKDFIIENDRDFADYLYLSSDLIHLKGKKYDGKRNQIRQFKRNYKYEFILIEENIIPECIKFQEEWAKEHLCGPYASLEEENKFVMQVLKNFKALDVFGAVIKINSKIEALTVAGELNPETALIHIEKANSKFKGIYQTINQQFCEMMLSKYKFINREQDMGDLGLRKAKLSYHPYKLISKKILRIK